MPDIKDFNVKGTLYDLKDAIARKNIGSLSDLRTTNKSSLVAAINEVAASGGSNGGEYTLPIGGDEIGGVKNGGNVIINEDGTMTALESSDISIHADMAQNDPAQPDYVKNRTHWLEDAFEEILPETTLEMANVSGFGMGETTVDHTKIILGKSYKMVWDGVVYESPSFESSGRAEEGGEIITLAVIGNPALAQLGEDNGIPFYGSNVHSGGVVTDRFAVVTANTDTTHTLSISAGSTAYHPLNEGFIPDSIARITDVTWENLHDKPFGEEGSGVTFEWRDGLEYVLHPDNPDAKLYKLSDTPIVVNGIVPDISVEMVIGGAVANMPGVGATPEETFTQEMVNEMWNSHDTYWAWLEFIVSVEEDTSFKSGTPISRGTWAVYSPATDKYPEVHIRKITIGSGESSIKTLDEKFIPDPIARKTDVTWEMLPDKPFGEELVSDELLPETTLDFEVVDGMGVIMCVASIDHNQIKEGQTYTFVLDGIAYETQAVLINAGAQVGIEAYVPYIGNLGLVDGIGYGESNGLPFMAGNGYNGKEIVDEFCIFLLGDASAQHTIGLSTQSPDIKKLDPKYLPDGGFGYEEDSQIISSDIDMSNTDTIYADGEVILYKVSDATPALVDIIGGMLELTTEDGNFATFEITAENSSESLDDGGGCTLIMIADVFSLYIVHADNYILSDIEFPKKGTYAPATVVDEGAFKITYGPNIVHQIDDKYIPDTIARKNDIENLEYSWTDLADKPFGEETVAQVELVNFISGFDHMSSIYRKGFYSDGGNAFNHFIPNDTYIVYWSGRTGTTEYVCPDVTTKVCEGKTNAYYLGNPSMYRNDNHAQTSEINTGEPFILEVTENGVGYFTTDGISGARIKIYSKPTVIYQLDDRFISDNIARSAASHGITVPDAVGDTPTAAEFNALLAALRDAGYLAT